MADCAASPDPLGAWDARKDWATWEHRPDATAWAQAHFHDVDRTYRAEFYLVDAPFAVLYRYSENDEGRRFLDLMTGDPAVDEPVVQMLGSLPPEHLLGVTDG